MEILLTILHIGVSLFLIFVVLLQSGQAADLAGAFGGGGSQTALGMRGAATLLQKLTTAAAVSFMLTSLALGIVGRSSSSSVIEGLDTTTPVEAPADPSQQQ
jgi:preprotein translocase subunit SecG